MIRVLLADDEILVINYLREIIDWREAGFEIVGCASNGVQALDLVDKLRPDLIISDIKMPRRDGLFLCRELKKRGSSIPIILLTAYQDFEYAQQAIESGVHNYILKHQLTAEMLKSKLKNVCEEIKLLQKNKQILQERIINDLLFGKANGESADTSIDTNGRFAILLVKRDQPFIAYNSHDRLRSNHNLHADKTISSSDFNCLRISDECCQSAHNTDFSYKTIADIPLDDNHRVIVLEEKNEPSRSKLLNDVLTFINDVKKQIQGGLGDITHTASVLYSISVKWDKLSEVFNRLARSMRYSIFLGTDFTRALSDISLTAEEDMLDQSINNLINCLSGIIDQAVEMNIEPASSTVERNIEPASSTVKMNVASSSITAAVERTLDSGFAMISSPSWNLSALKHMCNRLNSLIESYVEKYSPNDYTGTADQLLNDLGAYDMEQLKRQYSERLMELIAIGQYFESNSPSYSYLVQRAINLIDSRFVEPITLEDLGQALGVHGNYLGNIFKKETGTTFLKYLTNKRINKAKLLLETGNYNVSEVTEMVGYKTTQYFGKIFHDVVGMTPNQYKNRRR